MDLGITGRKALVLSSSRGLGRASARALAAEGAHVLVTGRDSDALSETVELIRNEGGAADCVAVDLSAKNAVDQLLIAVGANLGHVDILVNNTGGPPPGKVADIEVDTLEALFKPMVSNVIDLTARLLPSMASKGWGRVITIASSGVMQPIPTIAMSNVLRSALVGWSKTLAGEVAANGITVNMVLPGRVHTDRVDQLDSAAAERMGVTMEEARAKSLSTIPAGRLGTPDEFGAVVAFLASQHAAYVTGSMLKVDGGAVLGI